MAESKTAAEVYLTSLLNKMLRITTSDTRMFLGELKCTDADRNIILAHTYEYRLPPPPLSSSHPPNPDDASQQQQTITMDLTSRYLGLVVVPGEHVTKIEVEEFVSQVKNGGSKWLLPLDEYETQTENL